MLLNSRGPILLKIDTCFSDESVRIISARRASRKERAAYAATPRD